MKIILSSASPRRRELLSFIFSNFEIRPFDGPESAVFSTPGEYVKDLSKNKAAGSAGIERIPASLPDILKEDVSSRDQIQIELYIGSDTIVYADGKVLGKPADRGDAKRMLSLLSGRAHKVYTGVCLLAISEEKNEAGDCIRKPVSCRSFYCETAVYVNKLTDEEIDKYIDSGQPMDKAGGYGIQSDFSKHIAKIDGDYFNVVGLPVSMLYEELKKMFPLS